MKTPRLTSRRAILTASIGALLGMVGSSSAQTLYWDPLADGNGILGGAGTWNLTNLFWDPTGTDPVVADNTFWPNSATSSAVFDGTGGLVTINTGAGVTANTLVFDSTGYTVASNVAADVLTLAGTTPAIAVTSAGDFARINSIIAGTSGLSVAGGGSLILGGANTYAGQTLINNGTTVTLAAAGGLGATGAGNETIVSAGGTLNIGGQAVGGNPAPDAVTEIIQIAGSGVNGVGALINSGTGQNNATAKVVLTDNATVSAGAGISTSYNAGGQIVTSAGGRFDVRLSGAPTAGQKHLDLAGFTLTKTGSNLFALVNADVSNGNIVVNEGQVNLEAGTLVQGTGTITVNPKGILGFWAVGTTGTNITRQIVVNGGTVGDPTSTNAAQTVGSPIRFEGGLNPNFTAIATNRTTLSGVISQNAFTGTGLDKRGAGLLTFSNAGNTFSAPITVYAGTLGADYATPLAGGVPPGAAVALSGTPLGTAPTITLAGGTLNVRFDGSNDTTNNQVALFDKSIVLDRAPNAISLDRLTANGGQNKNLQVDQITFAPASAANGYSIGQNQLTMSQTNSFRLYVGDVTMNSDTVFNVGDFTYAGDITSANRNSFVKVGGNTIGFIGGDHTFNAFFQLGASNTRVGSNFGTPTTNNTATIGTGAIYTNPGSQITFRTPTNIAPGQTIEMLSQSVNQAHLNFEQFTSLPTGLRITGTGGVIGIGGASNFGDVDLSRLGDGTVRLGTSSNLAGNGTITGVISPGADDVARIGATGTGTLTVSGTNRLTGDTRAEIGSDLINGGLRTTIAATNPGQSGTVLLTGSNDYTGGTVINRGSTLRFQTETSLGTGSLTVGGTATAESVGNSGPHGAFTNAGPVTFLAGSGVRFVNDAITVDTTPTPNRWGDTVPMNLVGTTVEVRSRNIPAASDTIEVVGAMSVAGASALSLQRVANTISNHNVQLTVDSLSRVNQGTLELIRNTGNGAGYSTGHKFIVTNGAPTPVNGMVAPWIVAGNNGPIEFMNYGAGGFSVAATDQTVTTGTYTAGALNYDGLLQTGGKIQVTTADLTLTDNPILYALRSERTINSSGANNTITLRSGGLILRNITDNTTVTVNPALVANNGTANTELTLYTAGGGTGRNYQITGPITASGLTKFGGGNLNLINANPNLSGTFAINQGTVQAFGPAAAGTHNVLGTGNIRMAGGQLNLRSNNSALTGTVNVTLQNGITVAANNPLTVIDVNRSGADTASNGTFIFNPAVAASPGLVMEGSPGTQGQTLTVNGANYALQFGTNAQNSFAGNVTINNAVNVTINNAPSISGTNPVITKSGGGTLFIGNAAGTSSVATGTQIVVNGGSLEPRSILSFGPVANSSIVMNAGTLNLRRDTTAVWSGNTTGSGPGYNVTVNGNSAISADRLNTTAINQKLTLGALTMNGSAVFTASAGNGYAAEFQSVKLNGLPTISSSIGPGTQDSALIFSGQVSGGAFIKVGTGHLHLTGSNNTYDGGTYINQGILRARGENALGTGPVYLNPGAIIDFNNANNLGASQPVIVRGNPAFMPMISVNVNGVPHPTTNVDTTNATEGVIGLSNGTAGSYNDPIDLSIYGGGWSFGGVPQGAYDPVYTGPSILAGNNNLYRLGGGGTSFAMGTDSNRAALTNVLSGPNDVRLGFDSSNILPVNMTNFQYSIAGVNNYSGGSTVIHRGMVARLFSNNDGSRSGFSDSAVDVFGILSLAGQASLDNGGANVNAVTLHPGSALFLDNNNAAANTAGAFVAGNVSNRWNDTTPIALNSAMINLIGNNNAASSETVGDVTYSGNARLRAQLTGTGTATLTLNSLTAAGADATLMLQTSAVNTLGVGDKIIVATGAPAPVNGMLAPSIVNATDHTFVTYGANGFANVAYDSTVGASPIPSGLAPTTKLDINFTAGVALSDNPVVHAVRTNRDINLAGPFNTLTIRGGGLIGHANALTIQPHLVFNDGTNNIEAQIYNSVTVNINGTITANGVTKFGNGNLSINVPQTNYNSGWTVNGGTLQINDLEGLGQSVPSNTVTLNPALTTAGLASQALGMTNLTFSRNQGTPELQTFTGGPITVVNEATIRVAAGDDRNLQIPAVTLDSTSSESSVSFTFDVPNNRFRATIPSLTLNDDAIIRVTDSGATTDTGRITTGVLGQLVANNKDLVKIGNRTLELSNDNSSTFVGGSIEVNQGTVRVRHNGSLGSASTSVTISRNATIEVDTANFSPIATLNQEPGSIERWNREDARGGATYNLPSGVNLQLNTNLHAARTIGLNGGSIEGFLWTDHLATAVERTIGPNVTVNLLSNSFVGQNVIQGQGYDAGRQPTTGQPFGNTITGAMLRIEGNVVGAFDLTKTGFDTVTLAGTGNSYRNTIVDAGVLRLGVANALPITGTLTTRLNGTLDLYGNNQVVSGLGTPALGPNPGGTGVGSSGRITNSATTDNTLLVNAGGNFTYNGVIEQNVALTKAGGGDLTLGGANTYRGDTEIMDGTLIVTGSISGSENIIVGPSGTLDVAAAAGGFVLGDAQTLLGTGTVAGNVTIEGTVAPGTSPGTLAIAGTSTFNDGSTFALEIASASSYDSLLTSTVSLNGNVSLALSLGYTPALNTQFLVLDNSGLNPIGGTSGFFTWGGPEGLLTEGEEFAVGGSVFSISYAGGNGNNDVVLTSVPEPGSALMLLGGLGLLASRRRRS